MRNVPCLVLALGLAACTSGTSGDTSGLGGQPPSGLPPAVGNPDAGDGGLDGGDGGVDGGFDGGDGGLYDGGCGADFNAQAQNFCFGSSQVQPATGLHGVPTTCSISIFLSDVETCRGTIDSRNGSFDGGCGSLIGCSAARLPGDIACPNPASLDGGCLIHICRPSEVGCP